MALNEYLKQTQRFLREANQELINPGDLVSYVNRARREIAMRAQAIRILTPISGSVVEVNLTNGGSGYSNNPTITISAPDFPSGTAPSPQGAQATALAIVNGGVIQAIDVVFGGSGYFQPQVTITDATGTGATATATITPISQQAQGQEVYPFSRVDLSAYPGVESVYWVRKCSIIFSNSRYTVRMYSFSTYNAQIRTYPFAYQYTSFFASQYGRGTGGSFYLYPIPSQTYQMEWDCQCLPSDLVDDTSPEAIPMPFTEAVPWYAAHLGMIELMNFNAANFFLQMFESRMKVYQQASQPGGSIDSYGGRW